MSLYKQWMTAAYTRDGKSDPTLWNDYLPKEQKIYEHILENKIQTMEGTVSGLAEQFSVPETYICGFVDGIQEVLPEPVDLESLEPDSRLEIVIDFEALYKKMVEYKAEHLYTLEQWNRIFDQEKQKELYTEQKKSRTVVVGEKTGRNDPCPCGSGKKYKKCCGA